MLKKYIFLFCSLFIYQNLYAEGFDVIDKVKQALNSVTETKELKEKSTDKYIKQNTNQDNSLLDQINQTIDNFEIGDYANQLKEAAVDSIPDINFKDNSSVISMRDPFNLSSQMGSQRSGGFNFNSSFLPTNTSKIPSLKLRGVITPSSGKPGDLLALLEIDDKEVYMVRVGDEISYDPGKPNAAIKIININRLTVTVQAGSLGNVLVVR